MGSGMFFEQEYHTVIELLPQTDMIVMTRVKWTTTLNWLVEKAKQRMIPVVFDVDDRVFDLDALNTFANTLAIDLEHEYACDFGLQILRVFNRRQHLQTVIFQQTITWGKSCRKNSISRIK